VWCRHGSGACVWSADDAEYADCDTKRMMTVYTIDVRRRGSAVLRPAALRGAGRRVSIRLIRGSTTRWSAAPPI
jgi:hypothetical protein